MKKEQIWKVIIILGFKKDSNFLNFRISTAKIGIRSPK